MRNERLELRVKHIDAMSDGALVNSRDSGWRFTLRENVEVHDDWRVLWKFARILSNGTTVDVACPDCGAYFGTGSAVESVGSTVNHHITLARQKEQMAHVRESPRSCRLARAQDFRAKAAGE